MKINLIWAQDENGGIGKQGRLPWHIPEDLKNFKKLTLHHPVVMGRITWEGLPIKPLPKRRNIVISKTRRDDIECYSDLTSCLNQLHHDVVRSVFVIGGASIYQLFYSMATDLFISQVKMNTPDIDTFIPITTEMIRTDFKLKNTTKLSDVVTVDHWCRKSI